MLSEPTQFQSAVLPIAGGPSREELFDALRLHISARPFTVTFTAGKSTRFEVVITALEREDGSGETWNFKGFVMSRNPHDRSTTNVRGSYSTRTRKQGVIELLH